MSQPTLLVFTLLVLWLIVLVPMIFRRVDDAAPARSIRRFGRSMRLLNPGHAEPMVLMSSNSNGRGTRGVQVTRRPAPSAREGTMHVTHQQEMSEARRQMMARRRRSLTILSVGSVISLLLAFVAGGFLTALLATGFCLGLGGYVYFLRSQALRDRERREHREEREAMRQRRPFEQAEEHEEFRPPPDSMVRLDDDTLELHNMDTVDLTGVYDAMDEPVRQRRAS
jgi:hypothetical protein